MKYFSFGATVSFVRREVPVRQVSEPGPVKQGNQDRWLSGQEIHSHLVNCKILSSLTMDTEE